jgi:hypothetical protein
VQFEETRNTAPRSWTILAITRLAASAVYVLCAGAIVWNLNLEPARADFPNATAAPAAAFVDAIGVDTHFASRRGSYGARWPSVRDELLREFAPILRTGSAR